jgi:hypothetical protein
MVDKGRIPPVDLYVRGELPNELAGSFVIACSRRHKDRSLFSRWHDSQSDLVRIDITPGRPGRARAKVLAVDSSGVDVSARGAVRTRQDGRPVRDRPRSYLTQPNHGLNIENGTLWATNLLFGYPLEVDLWKWKPRRLLQLVEPTAGERATSTSHFAWSLDRRYAYFHESALTDESPAKAADLRIVRLDTRTGSERVWKLNSPVQDSRLEVANFHSAFYFEEGGLPHIGLLRTGAVVEHLAPHSKPSEHRVCPSPKSTIWVVPIKDSTQQLQAQLLPGIENIDAIALSHLDVDNRGGDGFVLYANYKEADVAEETHGVNVYGEAPHGVTEHYSGMTVEALNVGTVIRVVHRKGVTTVQSFKRAYDAGRTSLGHTWLPINIQTDATGKALFCTFAGFRPRLLPSHVARAYPKRSIDPLSVYYVPPVLMRFDANRLEPDATGSLSHISYAEPMAMSVVGSVDNGYVCTFSPELGLRVYRASDLSHMVAHVVAHPIWHCGSDYFRPAPAHMEFAQR